MKRALRTGACLHWFRLLPSGCAGHAVALRLAVSVSGALWAVGDACKTDLAALSFLEERIGDLARLQLNDIQNEKLPTSAREELKAGFAQKRIALIAQKGLASEDVDRRILLAKQALFFGPARSVDPQSVGLRREAEQLLRAEPYYVYERTLQDSGQEFTACAIRSDSQQLALGSYGTVQIWKVGPDGTAPAKPVTTSLKSGRVRALAFDPFSFALAAAVGGSLQILERDPVEMVNRGSAIISEIAFSRDGEWLAEASSKGGGLYVWKNGHRKSTALDSGAPYSSVVFSRDGNLLAAGATNENAIRIWKKDAGGTFFFRHSEYRTSKRPLPPPDFTVPLSVTLSPDGRYLAGGYHKHSIFVWRLTGERSKPLLVLSGHGGGVNSLSFSPDSALLASSSVADRDAKIWDIREKTTTPIQTLTGHSAGLNSVRFSPNGRFIVTTSADRTARIWINSRFKEAP